MNEIAGISFALFLVFTVITILVLTIAGYWKTFVKAGQPGWAILIPFYNIYAMLKIANRPSWWLLFYISHFILSCILNAVMTSNIASPSELMPFFCLLYIVIFIISCVVALDIAKRFGKGVWFGIGLMLLPAIFFAILGFGSAKYIPSGTGLKRKKRYDHDYDEITGKEILVCKNETVPLEDEEENELDLLYKTGNGSHERKYKAPSANLQRIWRESYLDGKLNPIHFLIPFIAITVFLAAILIIARHDTWVYAFFLKRGFVQWISLYCFVLSLVLLSRRFPIVLREKNALHSLKNGNINISRPCAVNIRLQRIRKHIKKEGVGNVRTYAQHLSEADSEELESGYSMSGVIVNVLPLIGFFGTVLGLSSGLYEGYIVKASDESTDSFIQAIGTAFDTTLLALGCTIVVIIIQRLIHKQEESCLISLNRYVDRYIYKKSKKTSLLKDDSCNNPTVKSLSQITDFVDGLSKQVADRLAEDITEAVTHTVNHSKTIISEVANQLTSIFNNEFSSASRLALDNLANQHELYAKEMLNNVTPRFAESLKDAVQSIEKRNGRETKAVANAIQTSLSSLGALIQAMVQGPEASLAYSSHTNLSNDSESMTVKNPNAHE